jgi:carboxymethylenebutenolidase
MYRAEPTGAPRGGIVVIQEIFGVNRHIRSVVDGFARDGYLTVAPAMFDRIEPNVELGYSPPERDRGRALRAQVKLADAMADVRAARDAVAHAGKVGVVGYCWGGYVSWMAAIEVELACAVVYYGAVLEDGDRTPRCPVMGHFGEADAMIPIDKIRAMAARHPEHQIFTYAADHGFNCDDRPTWEPESARLARERTLAFFREHVG